MRQYFIENLHYRVDGGHEVDVQISSFENTEDLLKLKIIASDRIVWKRLTEIICKHAEGNNQV